MTPFTFGMNQVATYWPPGTPDGVGGFAHGSPVAIACRWENKGVEFRSPDGETQVSDAVVYVDRELKIGGMLMREDQTGASGSSDPTTFAVGDDTPHEIRNAFSSPSIDANVVLYKVLL